MPALIRETFPVGALGCNCTVIACPESKEALVVDPGDEAEAILARLEALGVRAVRLVHTHAHLDHVLGTSALAASTGAEIWLRREDRWLYEHVPLQGQLFGWQVAAPTAAPTHDIEHEAPIAFGRREAISLHTPGHTPGSSCFFVEGQEEAPILLAGDTLFRGSVGRTDLWGGSFEDLRASIRGRLFALPDDTVVIPGHGPMTTIGAERESNPFVGDSAKP